MEYALTKEESRPVTAPANRPIDGGIPETVASTYKALYECKIMLDKVILTLVGETPSDIKDDSSVKCLIDAVDRNESLAQRLIEELKTVNAALGI